MAMASATARRPRKRKDALTPLRRMRKQRSCGGILSAHAALVPRTSPFLAERINF